MTLKMDRVLIAVGIGGLVLLTIISNPKPQSSTEPIDSLPTIESTGPQVDEIPHVVLKAKIQIPPVEETDFLFSRGLQRILSLQDKGVLTEEEKFGKQHFLSNPNNLRRIEKTLGTTTPEQFTRSGLQRRFETLFALEQALEWDENPLRDRIVQSLEKMISKTIPDHLSLDARRILVGDKMELYAMLAAKAPTRAQDILSQSRGTTLEKILIYASKRISY